MCALARARVYAKGRYFSLRNAPGRFQVVRSPEKVSFFFCEFAHPSFFPFCVLERVVLSTIFFKRALFVYFHHKTHARTPPHEEQNYDDDFNLFCYHYFSASDGWHGLDADDFLFGDGDDDDDEDELLLEKDEYDQTTTKPPPTNRRGSRWE